MHVGRLIKYDELSLRYKKNLKMLVDTNNDSFQKYYNKHSHFNKPLKIIYYFILSRERMQ